MTLADSLARIPLVTQRGYPADLAPDSFLTGIVGKPVFSLNFTPVDAEPVEAPATLAALMARAGIGDQPSLICCRVPADDVAGIQTLERAGFRTIECYLEFEVAIEPMEAGVPEASAGEVRAALPADLPDLAAIATRGFSSSRLHMDPAITQDQANESRRLWLLNALNGRAEAVYCTLGPGGRPTGFVICKATNAPAPTGRLDLIAVAPDSRGRGYGRTLAEAFIQHCRLAGHARGRVGTQAHNRIAIRLYESLGFRLDSAFITLHAHLTGRPQ